MENNFSSYFNPSFSKEEQKNANANFAQFWYVCKLFCHKMLLNLLIIY